MKPNEIVSALPGGSYLAADGSYWRNVSGRWVRVSASETAFTLQSLVTRTVTP